MIATNPFALPSALGIVGARTLTYWSNLRRAGNEVPFADDISLAALSGLSDRLLLVSVFSQPRRFRLETVGSGFADGNSGLVTGLFCDQVSLHGRLAYLVSQCDATVEGLQPTAYRGAVPGKSAFTRLLLPAWGDGRITIILGAIDDESLP